VADADAGVVDQDIDCSHGADGLGEGGFDLRAVGYVGEYSFGDFWELVAGCVAGFCVAVEDADLGAFVQESDGCGCAYAAGASGDQDSFVLQTLHAVLNSCDAMIRSDTTKLLNY
jgi:hypothetical protein